MTRPIILKLFKGNAIIFPLDLKYNVMFCNRFNNHIVVIVFSNERDWKFLNFLFIVNKQAFRFYAKFFA